MSLSLHDVTGNRSPATHLPFQSAGTGIPVPPAKALLSGQMPVSMTPTITPAPARRLPPSCDHRPVGPSRPRNVGLRLVSGCASLSFDRLMTPFMPASFDACLGVNFTATALFVTV